MSRKGHKDDLKKSFLSLFYYITWVMCNKSRFLILHTGHYELTENSHSSPQIRVGL